jgi:CDP-glycerol:poly(glycerophosphate) glycerophosphotransferase
MGEDGSGNSHTAADIYRSFQLPPTQVLPLEKALRGEYDMVFCAHISGYFPARDHERVQIFHGLSFRNMAIRRDVLIYDHLFIAGPYMMRAFQEAQLLRPGDPRCVPVGFPKTDCLVDGTLDRSAILRRLRLSGRRPVVLYAPTGQINNSLDTLGEEVIRRLQRSGRYDILIKIHDHPRARAAEWSARLRPILDENLRIVGDPIEWPERLRPLLNGHTRLVRDYDVSPYLFAADLLITDASSVSSEYSLLNRPMVFLDVPELLKAVSKKGVRLDLDTWGRRGGVTVRWPDEAADAVAWSLAHPKQASDVRREMARDLFYNPGHAADAAVQWILARLGLPGSTQNLQESSSPATN